MRLPLDKRLKAKLNSQARHHDKNSIEQSRLKKARLKGELADIERTITENRLRIDSEAHTIEDLKKDENMKAGVYIFLFDPPPRGGAKIWTNIMLGEKMIEKG